MKYILVTGASGGIGKATTLNLLKEGYYVIGLDILDNDIKDEQFHFIKCDLTDINCFESIKQEVESITNELYAIMNIAGIFKMQSMLEGKEEDLRKVIEINFFSVYRLNKTFYPLLKEGSKILIFSSEVARYSPQPFDGYYSLSKVLVDSYADILRRELNYFNIKVIKVQSGAIKTNLLNGVNSKYDVMLENTKLYKEPLTKLKKLMDNEIEKQVDPNIVGIKLTKIIGKKHNKLLYKIKNSFKLRFLNALPEKLQDIIYLNVIK